MRTAASEQVSTRALKILVIDDDETTASAVGTILPPDRCEVIQCREMALAEVATDLTEFDLILVAPSTTGVEGPEGLAVADFLAARNPLAATTLLVSNEDEDLRTSVEKRGRFRVLGKPLEAHELLSIVSDLAPAHSQVARR